MKGLLIKDFMLMKNQKNFFIMLIVIAVGMTYFSNDCSFIVGYLTFISSFFVLSTISYDEYDNGNSFLFSLPISRQLYAIEKYVFSLIISLCFWILSMIFTVFYQTITIINFNAIEWILTSAMLLPILIIIISTIIPFQLKFGSEKGRFAMIGAFGVLFILGILLFKAAKILNIDIDALLQSLSTLHLGTIVIVSMMISLLYLVISQNFSIRIMKKKEF